MIFIFLLFNNKKYPQGREYACNIIRLPPGSVIFEDVDGKILKGQVLKPLDQLNARSTTDPLPGRIRYRAADYSEVEVPFGDKDQVGILLFFFCISLKFTLSKKYIK